MPSRRLQLLHCELNSSTKISTPVKPQVLYARITSGYPRRLQCEAPPPVRLLPLRSGGRTWLAPRFCVLGSRLPLEGGDLHHPHQLTSTALDRELTWYKLEPCRGPAALPVGPAAAAVALDPAAAEATSPSPAGHFGCALACHSPTTLPPAPPIFARRLGRSAACLSRHALQPPAQLQPRAAPLAARGLAGTGAAPPHAAGGRSGPIKACKAMALLVAGDTGGRPRLLAPSAI